MEITIRKAIPEDANKIIEMFNKLDKELEFLLLDFNEKKITENDEVIFIKNFNKKNNIIIPIIIFNSIFDSPFYKINLFISLLHLLFLALILSYLPIYQNHLGF